jgi:Spy/CpxP family protein refolding chaperone
MSSGLKLRIAVGLVLIFLAGVASGVFAGAWHAHQDVADRHGPRMAQRMRERMRNELNLTPAQMQELGPILDDTAQQLQQIRRETAQRVSETIARSHEQVAVYLTPEQREDLHEMEQRQRRFWSWHHPRRPFAPPQQ